MTRRLILLLAASTVCLPVAAQAGKNAAARILVGTAPYSEAAGSCTALVAAGNGCDGAGATADAAWADVLVPVYAYQRSADDPYPGQPGAPGLHMTGIDFGVDYDATKLTVNWTMCGGLEIGTDGTWHALWPLPGSGDSVIWPTVQRGEQVLVGYFRVEVHAPAILRIVGHPEPTWGLGLLDDEYYLDPINLAGEAGLGGALGMNPCAVAVRNATWGSIKSLYGH